MLTRIRTGFLLLFAGCLFLLVSHIPAVLLAVVCGLSALAMTELAEALGLKKLPMAITGVALALMACCLDGLWRTLVLGALFGFYLLSCWGIMAGLPGKKDFHPWEKLSLILAPPVFLAVVWHLRRGDAGLYHLILPVLICAATDTFAYFVGRQLGKHPLAPHISPKKTLEGAVGGTVLALAMMVLLGLCLEWAGLARVRMNLLILYALTASVVGQFGDLCLSAVKRVAGVKDFSDVLPGHGGILDRMDSCLLALPYTMLFIACFGPIIL